MIFSFFFFLLPLAHFLLLFLIFSSEVGLSSCYPTLEAFLPIEIHKVAQLEYHKFAQTLYNSYMYVEAPCICIFLFQLSRLLTRFCIFMSHATSISHNPKSTDRYLLMTITSSFKSIDIERYNNKYKTSPVQLIRV